MKKILIATVFSAGLVSALPIGTASTSPLPSISERYPHPSTYPSPSHGGIDPAPKPSTITETYPHPSSYPPPSHGGIDPRPTALPSIEETYPHPPQYPAPSAVEHGCSDG